MNSINKSDIDKVFGKVLKNYREKSGLTQEQLSEELGISPKYISRIENGNSGIKTQTLIKYINTLKIFPNSFFKDFVFDEEMKSRIILLEKINELPKDKIDLVNSIVDLLRDFR